MGRQWFAKRTPCAQGQMHGSAGEALRCNELHVHERIGLIGALLAHPQPSWSFDSNGVHIGRFTADFDYVRDGKRVVEDYKGARVSRDVILRHKLMQALYGIEVYVHPPRKPKTRRRKSA